MALWVCGGEAGCGTKYAVGLFRCPRCHNTEFFEDGDPMAKISRAGGASDKTLPAPDPEVEAVDVPAPEPSVEEAPAVEPLDVTDYVAGPVEPVTEKEGGGDVSAGSSSSASTETPQPNSEPSETPTPSPAPTTDSRSRKGRTGSRSASSTAGGQETGTSAADGTE